MDKPRSLENSRILAWGNVVVMANQTPTEKNRPVERDASYSPSQFFPDTLCHLSCRQEISGWADSRVWQAGGRSDYASLTLSFEDDWDFLLCFGVLPFFETEPKKSGNYITVFMFWLPHVFSNSTQGQVPTLWINANGHVLRERIWWTSCPYIHQWAMRLYLSMKVVPTRSFPVVSLHGVKRFSGTLRILYLLLSWICFVWLCFEKRNI